MRPMEGVAAREEVGASPPPPDPLHAEGPAAPPPPEPARPAFGECLGAAFRASRSAFSPEMLFPAWAAMALLRLAVDSGRGGPVRMAAAALLGGALVLAASGLLSVLAGFEFGRGERLGVSGGLRALSKRLPAVVIAALFVPAGALLLLAIATLGAALLALVPVAGKTLAVIYLSFPGIPLLLLGSGLLVLGAPSLPLIIASASLEPPYPFDAVSRSLSYARARPLRYLLTAAAGLLGAAAGGVVVCALIALTVSGLVVSSELAAGSGGWAELGSSLRASIAACDLLWPLPGGPPSAAQLAPPAPAWALGLAGRFLTGYLFAALAAAFTRAYLLLRWDVDGEPPGSLLPPGEKLEWAE